MLCPLSGPALKELCSPALGPSELTAFVAHQGTNGSQAGPEGRLRTALSMAAAACGGGIRRSGFLRVSGGSRGVLVVPWGILEGLGGFLRGS